VKFAAVTVTLLTPVGRNRHIPALKALPEYELRAISTNRRDSAGAAARAFGVFTQL
jgi:hypothetical protein